MARIYGVAKGSAVYHVHDPGVTDRWGNVSYYCGLPIADPKAMTWNGKPIYPTPDKLLKSRPKGKRICKKCAARSQKLASK